MSSYIVWTRPAARPPARRMPHWAPGFEPWQVVTPHREIAGLGRFLKKVRNAIHKVVTAPIRILPGGKALLKPLDKANEKLEKINDKIEEKVGHFVKKYWVYIVIVLAILITIYTMGAGAGIAAKMVSGAIKLKALLTTAYGTAKTWVVAHYSTLSKAMTALHQGSKMGSLPPEQVQALGEANGATGETIVPPEVLAYLQAKPVLVPTTADDPAAIRVDTAPDGTVIPADPSQAAYVPPANPGPDPEAVRAEAGIQNQRKDLAAASAAYYQRLRGLPVTGTDIPDGITAEQMQQVADQSPMQARARRLSRSRNAANTQQGSPSSGLPSWAIPAGIGVGVLVLMLAMRK